jgi:hypothetical protein
LVQGPGGRDSQGILLRHTSGKEQQTFADSRNLDGRAVGSDRPQLTLLGATFGLPMCYAYFGSEPPFPSMCGSRLLGPRHKARRGGGPVACSA